MLNLKPLILLIVFFSCQKEDAILLEYAQTLCLDYDYSFSTDKMESMIFSLQTELTEDDISEYHFYFESISDSTSIKVQLEEERVRLLKGKTILTMSLPADDLIKYFPEYSQKANPECKEVLLANLLGQGELTYLSPFKEGKVVKSSDFKFRIGIP